jgi:hypothetical protein
MKKIFILTLIVFLFVFSFVYAEFKIENPLEFDTFNELIAKLIEWVKMMAFAIVGLVIVWSGLSYATAGGNPQKIETAKRMLLYAAIGLGIVLLAESLVDSLQKIIELPSET